MTDYCINIVHLYPDLLNLYGDKGNIECMRKRLLWRGIDVSVKACTNQNNEIDFENTDIIFVGGGSDREQQIVCSKLLAKKDDIKKYVENDGSLIAVCGGYQLLGQFYKTSLETIEGLGILDVYTDSIPNSKRLIGNIIIKNDDINMPIVGFENHGGRTFINNHKPLGTVISGFGNNDTCTHEGVIYKNVIGTYLHGPLLPKNPMLCDYILQKALKHKYSDFNTLSALDDSLEKRANEYMIKQIMK